MKKLLFSISFLCYLAVTTGVIINSHYCMDRLASVRLFETEAKTCTICGMDFHTSNDCCRNEVKVEKLEQDQETHSFPHPGIAKLSVPVIELVEHSATVAFEERTGNRFHNHSPPLLSASDTYLVNRVFRI